LPGHTQLRIWPGKVPDDQIGENRCSVPYSGCCAAGANESQKERKHELLFTTENGTALDANNLRHRYLHPLLMKLTISKAGFHAFRHGNASALAKLGASERTIDDRQGRLGNSSHTHRLRAFRLGTERGSRADAGQSATE
jgi:integrase